MLGVAFHAVVAANYGRFSVEFREII